MHVETSERAERFIRSHGGSAYVWLEEGLCAATERPEDVPFEEVLADGYRLFVDTRMARPKKLEVSLVPGLGLRAVAPTSKVWFWRAVIKSD